MTSQKRAIRIANCSGYLGDRRSALSELLQGDPVDVITGDYLAELTMGILWKVGETGRPRYATALLDQLEDNLATCVERGIKVVTNAGGLDPVGLAQEIVKLADRLGLTNVKVAYLTGDDLTDRFDAIRAEYPLRNLHTGLDLPATAQPVTVNAYLGAWGIVEALRAGADIVVCPRVTDASLVVGPAAWWHGWARDDWNALAGAVAAGHAIECGAHVSGGNYAFIDEVPTEAGLPGFPIAEVHADGTTVITKQPGTGGVISVGTVTAQLLYEVDSPYYLGPDVIADFGSLRLRDVGPNRVEIAGCQGHPPTGQLKLSLNLFGGYRNSMTLRIPRPDVERKAAWVQRQLTKALGGPERFDELRFDLIRSDIDDARVAEEATASLRVTAKSMQREVVDRAFSNAVLELGLSSYAGFHTMSPPSSARTFMKFWPCLVPADVVEQQVAFLGPEPVPAPVSVAWTPGQAREFSAPATEVPATEVTAHADEPARLTILGAVCGARSGDKGGAANVGVWARSEEAHEWLRAFLTLPRLKELIPEAEGLRVERHEFPNLRALNFVLYGYLGDGASAATVIDTQAKGLGEFLRSRVVDIPLRVLRSVEEVSA